MTENQRIKLVRETLNISQSEFAESLGIKQPTLSNIEGGNTTVSNKVRGTLVDKHHVNPEWLFRGAGNMFSVAPKKYKDDKDHIIALLEDQVRLLQSQVADKIRLIELLERQITDKSRTNSAKKS